MQPHGAQRAHRSSQPHQLPHRPHHGPQRMDEQQTSAQTAPPAARPRAHLPPSPLPPPCPRLRLRRRWRRRSPSGRGVHRRRWRCGGGRWACQAHDRCRRQRRQRRRQRRLRARGSVCGWVCVGRPRWRGVGRAVAARSPARGGTARWQHPRCYRSCCGRGSAPAGFRAGRKRPQCRALRLRRGDVHHRWTCVRLPPQAMSRGRGAAHAARQARRRHGQHGPHGQPLSPRRGPRPSRT